MLCRRGCLPPCSCSLMSSRPTVLRRRSNPIDVLAAAHSTSFCVQLSASCWLPRAATAAACGCSVPPPRVATRPAERWSLMRPERALHRALRPLRCSLSFGICVDTVACPPPVSAAARYCRGSLPLPAVVALVSCSSCISHLGRVRALARMFCASIHIVHAPPQPPRVRPSPVLLTQCLAPACRPVSHPDHRVHAYV